MVDNNPTLRPLSIEFAYNLHVVARIGYLIVFCCFFLHPAVYRSDEKMARNVGEMLKVAKRSVCVVGMTLRYRKNNPGEVVITGENGEQRVLRSTPDWSEAAVNSDHLWIPTSASGDLCYLAEAECTVSSSSHFIQTSIPD